MKISSDFGIVINKKAVTTHQIDLESLLLHFNFDKYFDESNHLISIGPFFGSDMADECMRQLEKLGLTYIDDFFIFAGDFPSWCTFSCHLKE